MSYTGRCQGGENFMLKIKLLVVFSLLFLPALAHQSSASQWPSKLTTLKALPSSESMTMLELNPSLNADHGGRVDEGGFKRLMNTAKPLDASDPIIKGWHYAPGYSGRFFTKEGMYQFSLYLGGLGWLLAPKQGEGMFLFDPKVATAVAAQAPVRAVGKEAQAAFEVLLAAIEANDFAGFVAVGDAAFKAGLTKEAFAQVVAQMAPRLKQGYEATYLGALKQQGYQVYLWKVAFKDEADDLLVKLVMKDGKVSGFFLI
ncbi:MAG TPA: hypothetical protein VNA16_05690, partial [Abditibacteriaceae bacterium]|nr:hypothetical protein [Abditibacteriaceae bacterium]